MDTPIALAVVLGLLEGLTEFLPVSSTGHLLLADYFLGFDSQGNVFEIVIQFGAILAIILLYFMRLWRVALAMPTSAAARQFVAAVALAFLPAACVGVTLHGFIKGVLFESPQLIAISLIVGGIIILIVEKLPKKEAVTDVERMPLKTALGIGLFQCIAIIPGVSRSGATIVGALLLGVGRKAAAEFSFFLSIPTMLGAASYDLYKNYAILNADDGVLIAVGFFSAFLAALVVVKPFVSFVARRGFVPFAWYRIALGSLVLLAISLGY